MACGLLVNKNFPNRISFKTIAGISMVMNSVIFALDLILGANYGYLIKVPIEIFANVPSVLVFLIMTTLTSLVIYLIEKIKAKSRDKSPRNSIYY